MAGNKNGKKRFIVNRIVTVNCLWMHLGIDGYVMILRFRIASECLHVPRIVTELHNEIFNWVWRLQFHSHTHTSLLPYKWHPDTTPNVSKYHWVFITQYCNQLVVVFDSIQLIIIDPIVALRFVSVQHITSLVPLCGMTRIDEQTRFWTFNFVTIDIIRAGKILILGKVYYR